MKRDMLSGTRSQYSNRFALLPKRARFTRITFTQPRA